MKLLSEIIIRGPLHLLLNYVVQVAIYHFAHVGYNNFRLVTNKERNKTKNKERKDGKHHSLSQIV